MGFSRLKHLDLSRNAVESLEVCCHGDRNHNHVFFPKGTARSETLRKFESVSLK